VQSINGQTQLYEVLLSNPLPVRFGIDAGQEVVKMFALHNANPMIEYANKT
jgi:hypothetical protein